MALTYQSGEDIQIGDRVTYGGNAGTIELVVETFLRSFPRWGGPLIRRAFEEYATGRFTEEQLLKQVGAWGLTNRRGRPFTSQAIGVLLRNQVGVEITARSLSRSID